MLLEITAAGAVSQLAAGSFTTNSGVTFSGEIESNP
jgi:hypothetical protein